MLWANFLHIYQPAGQSKQILNAVANQSYRRIFRGLKKIGGFKITLNINAALSIMLLENGFEDIINDIRELAESGRLEFTESAKYHAFLPFLGEKEIEAQIRENNKENKRIFGEAYQPKCFFPPEMAYSEKVAKVVEALGYPLIMLDEISYCGQIEKAPYDKIFTIEGTNLSALFRQRRASNLIMSGVVRDKESFFKALSEEMQKNIYLLTAMDGETFGHHRPGLENFLFQIVEATKDFQIFASEIPTRFPVGGEIKPVEATWASKEKDIAEKKQFFSWHDPNNKIHNLQWGLLNLLLENCRQAKELPEEAIKKCLRAMASDQFFWASGEPWWSIEMIERGAWQIIDALQNIPGIAAEEIEKGKKLYSQILYEAFAWQRKGKIEKLSEKYKEAVKIPFKERTLEKGKPEVYYAFIDMMKKKMREEAEKNNFEKAILWRDAIWKLETKNDIYDAIHATDLLRQEVPAGELERLMDKYKEEYKKISPGQPESRGT